MTIIEMPGYIYTEYEKITETDYPHLIDKHLNTVKRYEKTSLYGYAENGTYNWTTKQITMRCM